MQRNAAETLPAAVYRDPSLYEAERRRLPHRPEDAVALFQRRALYAMKE